MTTDLSSPNRLRLAGLLAALLLLLAAGAYMMWPAHDTGPAPVREEKPSAVALELRQRIDAWVVEKHLNKFGDPPGTDYNGGTPLFNEKTGERRDRYEYILSKHPELNAVPGRK